jgi:hypothetical protein
MSACQNQESPTEPAASEIGTPISTEAPLKPIEGGRKATDDEVARIMEARKTLEAVEAVPESGARPLAKTAALSTCIVDFNSPFSLSLMSDQAYTTFTSSPHYIHGCNSSQYWVYSWPININHFHLVPENSNYCIGSPYKIGVKSGSNCVSQSDAKNWPRFATNMGGNSGVQFYVKSGSNVRKNFNLQAIRVLSGTMEVYAYRIGIGWWVWYPLTEGNRWYWPANTTVSEIQVFDHGKNGTVTYDNLEVAIIP